MPNHLRCWLGFFEVFVRNSPFGLPIKCTLNITRYQGERLQQRMGIEPRDVVDAYNRPCKQIELSELVAVEWLANKPAEPVSAAPATWGMMLERPKK